MNKQNFQLPTSQHSNFSCWKLIIGCWMFAFFALAPKNVMAAPATQSAVATKSATATASGKLLAPDPKAQELLDRVATKVAQLTDQLKKTYSGNIKTVGKNSYNLATPEGERLILTNDVTTFYRFKSGKISEAKFSTIKKGEDLTAIGTTDPQTNEMTARQVIAKVERFNLVGKITEISKGIATIDIDGTSKKVDLNGSPLKKIDSTNKIVPAKLADVKVDSQIFVIAYDNDGSGVLNVLKAMVLSK